MVTTRIPTLSFCITCKNRLYQIRQTLRKNLDDNLIYKDSVDFVLVDFGSSDGLKEWVASSFKEELESGYLKYYYTDALDGWHASIAKNTSHLMSNKEILVNLDCDNFTGIRGAAFVIRHFLENVNDIVLHQFLDDFNGSFGRISVKREHFLAIGGYNESLLPMGYEDVDFIERLKSIGLTYIHDGNKRYNQAIPNSREEGLVNIKEKVSYAEMVRRNRTVSENNISEGHIIANMNRDWGLRNNISDIYGNPISI